MREAGQALLLVALEEVDADRRPRPQHADGEQHGDQPDRAEVLPRRPADEEHRAERGEVDERRAEVGLGEHEHDRQQAEPDHAQRRPDLVQPPRPLGDEAGEREDEEQLPELRRLEGEEADVDPARRAAGGAAEDEHDRDQSDGADEDRAPVAPVEVGIDERRDDERDAADGRVDDLPVEVVARVAGDVEPRHAGDPPEPDGDEPGDAGEQHPVERAEDADEGRALGAPVAQPCPLGSGVLEHQSEWIGPSWWALTWKNSEKTCSAAGAAAVPPWPPFSITAQTTIFAEFVGPYPHHHDWFCTPR